jgi:predicted HTH transcriptional regulator
LKDNAGFVTLTFVLPASVAPRMQGSDLEKTSGKILDAVRQNPQVTIPELSAQIGVTTRSIERNLQKLQDEKRLRRIGPAKGGHWQVLE